jgi:hypothetical protein
LIRMANGPNSAGEAHLSEIDRVVGGCAPGEG